MPVKILGKESDVRKYRSILEKRGIYTKSNDPVYDQKPEGYRLITGDLTYKWAKMSNGAWVESKGMKADPDAKLYITGIANAKISDRMDEVLEPSGIDIRNYLKNKILLADHMYFTKAAIGIVEEIRVEDTGVKFDAWIGDPQSAQLTDHQKEIRSLVAQGILKTVSVGFIPKEIRAPEFSDDGKLLKPAVITKWELLELSIVAVPCNPDATFEMRQYAERVVVLNDSNSSKSCSSKQLTDVKDLIDDIKNKEVLAEIQKLIFSKNTYQVSDAKSWAKDNGFKNNKVDEDEKNIYLEQYKPDDFEDDSFKTIELDKDVSAITGKLKGKMMEKILEELLGAIKNQNTVLEGLKEAVNGTVKASETILSHLAKGSNPDKEEDDEKEDDEKDKKKSSDDLKELKETLGTMTSTFEKSISDLWEAVKAIAEKLAEKE